MRVEACSMIREGAVCRPSPPSSGWDPSEECFEKEGARVRFWSVFYLTWNCVLTSKYLLFLSGPRCFQESCSSCRWGRREQLQYNICLSRWVLCCRLRQNFSGAFNLRLYARSHIILSFFRLNISKIPLLMTELIPVNSHHLTSTCRQRDKILCHEGTPAATRGLAAH